MAKQYFIVGGERQGPVLFNDLAAGQRSLFLDTTSFATLKAENVWGSTDTPDVMAFLGYTGAFGQVGNIIALETADAFAALGYPLLNGRWTSLETIDKFSAFGRQPQTVVLNVTEAKDTFHAIGLGQGVNGIFVTTEAIDIFAAMGNTPISGPFTTNEAPDRFVAIGVNVLVASRHNVQFFVT